MDINEIRIGMVDVDSIRVINSRNRDTKKYNEIISSIKTLDKNANCSCRT